MFIIFIFFFLKSITKNNKNDISLYECGYKEFNIRNIVYSAQFFLIALSFMLFDIEIVFFIPFLSILSFSLYLKLMFSYFILFLLIRLLYELYVFL